MPVPQTSNDISAGRWIVRSPQDLLWRTWGTDSLLFDPRSGDTHLLDEVARNGLLCLQEEPLHAGQLAQRLSEWLDLDLDDELRQYVDVLLRRFFDAGLIESD
ncbi:MAG: HPr-rel-A system PqqD family peptide chaperone [Planctomycetaceae bacterium]|nr:HPr-rel-A system PqqD family peptide chaperone [Planctomycetaceae bacterium]